VKQTPKGFYIMYHVSTIETSYRRAVQVLKPNMKRMRAIKEAHAREVAEAEKIVAAMIAETGKTGTELYHIVCDKRHPNETSLDKTVRVILLGYARKGK
jgi:hypothetical protein